MYNGLKQFNRRKIRDTARTHSQPRSILILGMVYPAYLNPLPGAQTVRDGKQAGSKSHQEPQGQTLTVQKSRVVPQGGRLPEQLTAPTRQDDFCLDGFPTSGPAP